MITEEVRREWRGFQMGVGAWILIACAIAGANAKEKPVQESVELTLTIVSGGQTGADRGALEAARDLGTPYDGWVPKGRKAEDGAVPAEFKLREMLGEDYQRRTWANVRDSHGTVVVCPVPVTGGSRLTIRYCLEQERPAMLRAAHYVIEFPEEAAAQLWGWVKANKIEVLNVAGSRESRCPGLQAAVRTMITRVLHLAAQAAQ